MPSLAALAPRRRAPFRPGYAVAAAVTAFALLGPLAEPGWSDPVRVFAHRGAADRFPENSLAACRAALALGASCELDVRAARDGQLVLMHDPSVRRTTTGRGRVARRTLAQLRGLWLRDARGVSQERIPTLVEALALERGGRALLLDLKRSDAAFNAQLASTLAPAASGALLLAVRNVAQARVLRAALPHHGQVALIDGPGELEAHARAGVETIRLRSRWLERDPSLAARVRAHGAALMVHVEDPGEATLKAVLSHAPDAVLSDAPAAALAALAAREPAAAP